MNLNLHLLRDDLEQLHLKGQLFSEPYIPNCNYPLYFDNPDLLPQLQPNILYIVPSDFLLKGHLPLCSLSIICVGKPCEEWLNCGIDLLYTEEEISCSQVLMMVAERFFFYTQWEKSLQTIVDNRRSLRDLIRCTETIFQNPIGIECDSFLQLLTYVPDALAGTDKAKQYYAGYQMISKIEASYMQPEWKDFLTEKTNYDTGNGLSAPLFVDHGIGPAPTSLYCNFRKEDRLICRVYLDEFFTPITDKHLFLIRVLTEYVAKYLGDEYVLKSNQPQYLEAVANALLRKEAVSDLYIQSTLSTLGWNETGKFYFVILRPNKKGHKKTLLETWAQKITETLNCFCFYYTDQDLRFILNLEKLEWTWAQIQDFFQRFSASYNARIGCSVLFSNFRMMYQYANQAEFILQQETAAGCYSFEKYYLAFWREKILCTKETAAIKDSLVPEGLKALISYDERKHTEFTQLLLIYLENDRNIAKTIKQAYLHRNTFLYQIEKIKGILGMDLEDPNDRLLLLMAYEVIKSNNPKGC